MKATEKMVLDEALLTLRLSTMKREYECCARQADESGDSYGQYLLNLANREIECRQSKHLARRLKEGCFPQMKTLEKTDLAKWPGLGARELQAYASGEYIKAKQNIVLVGKHGTGKTHAATALGIEACRQGYRVRFTTAAALVNELLEAHDQAKLTRTLKRLNAYPLLIIDELGYIPFSRKGAQLLFQVFSERYEQSATLVTSNLSFGEWTQVFGDANLTAALLDRLTHHCHIHQFDWESIRFTESLKNRKGQLK